MEGQVELRLFSGELESFQLCGKDLRIANPNFFISLVLVVSSHAKKWIFCFPIMNIVY